MDLTHLTYTGLRGELEHLNIETRLISETVLPRRTTTATLCATVIQVSSVREKLPVHSFSVFCIFYFFICCWLCFFILICMLFMYLICCTSHYISTLLICSWSFPVLHYNFTMSIVQVLAVSHYILFWCSTAATIYTNFILVLKKV